MLSQKELKIKDISAFQILDSRANPTVQVKLVLSDGKVILASAPSGASKGKTEALELRDNNPDCLFSKGVTRACRNVEQVIAPRLIGLSPVNQFEVDSILEELDGTSNFSKLGANAALAVSSAVMIAGSYCHNLELFQYIGGFSANTMPIPMINILNGGVHADNKLDFQEFMIVPAAFDSFKEALFVSVEIFHSLKQKLKKNGYSIGVGDEGGFSPAIYNPVVALELLTEAIEAAGYSTNTVKIALDVAASEFYRNEVYNLKGLNLVYTTEQMIDYLEKLVKDYPIVSIEDGLAQDDYDGWKKLTRRLGDKIMLVGDDLFTTNSKLLKRGIEKNIANSVLIKPNQIGTITKTFECVKTAKAYGYSTIISHRSGETESTMISDIAVGLNSGFIKTGSLTRGERTAKYNRLLYIERLLAKSVSYGKPF